ncbi:MAG: hypothetical protein GF372_02145 [Candidatus Marinimicrobia bacterium]|nr:hypothetical protein [Candidatus Neomarinimicrobiota bacterium]
MNQKNPKSGIIGYDIYLNGEFPLQLKILIISFGLLWVLPFDYHDTDFVEYLFLIYGAAIIMFPLIQHKIFVSWHLAFNEHGIFGKTGFRHWINLPWEEIEEIRREDNKILIVTEENTVKFSTKFMAYWDRVHKLPDLKDLAESRDVKVVNLIRTMKSGSQTKSSEDNHTIGYKPTKFDFVRLALFIFGVFFLLYFFVSSDIIRSLLTLLPGAALLSLSFIYPAFIQPDYLVFDNNGIRGKVGSTKNLNKSWDEINLIEHQPPHLTFRLESGEKLEINYYWLLNPNKIRDRYKDFLPELERVAEMNGTPFTETFDYKPRVAFSS